MQEKAKTAAEERTTVHSLEAARKKERILESEKVSKEWNKKKSFQQANTTCQTITTPRLAWCPARSLSSVRPNRIQRQSTMNTTTTDHVTGKEERCKSTSYSQDSFSSECISEPDDSGEEDGHNNINTTGTLKTVQVCCKTLEYWCNCGH